MGSVLQLIQPDNAVCLCVLLKTRCSSIHACHRPVQLYTHQQNVCYVWFATCCLLSSGVWVVFDGGWIFAAFFHKLWRACRHSHRRHARARSCCCSCCIVHLWCLYLCLVLLVLQLRRGVRRCSGRKCDVDGRVAQRMQPRLRMRMLRQGVGRCCDGDSTGG